MKRYDLSDQYKTPLYDAVRKVADWNPAPFFVPGHKMGEGTDPRFKTFLGENLFRIDVSEVRWTDDFHNASSSILEAQELAADAWGAAKSHFLINGTSGGIIASICAVCGEEDRIIVPRNAHKSVVYGLIISGAEPVYAMPEIDRERSLVGGLSPQALKRAFAACPEAKAVFTVSPTYYGVMSDTAALAEIAHRRGAVLIADEAHGNHVYFSERLPKGALELGADIVCQSTHKMSGSLDQSSMLHLGPHAAERVDFCKVQANLSMIQTTSPSYILLASLDMARSFMATQGASVLDGVLDALEKARLDIGELPGIELLGNEVIGNAGIHDYEPTRLVFSARALGIDGHTLFRILREQYDIECEFADPVWCVCVAGPGTTRAHTEALTRALSEIARVAASRRQDRSGDRSIGQVSQTASVDRQTDEGDRSVRILPPIPPLCMRPREAWFADKEPVPFETARGRISAEMVVPYPPGIPVLCPGERITADVHEYLSEQRTEGRHLHCAAGDSPETILVVK